MALRALSFPNATSPVQSSSGFTVVRSLLVIVGAVHPTRLDYTQERAAKHARKTERRARKVAEKAGDADVHEEADDHVPEEEVPLVVQPTISDEWLPEHEQGGNSEEEAQESDEEDVVAVISRRRKATGKLKLNENRTQVGNKRVPNNVAAVSTGNVVLNSEEEEAKWRFVANKRVAPKKILSEVIKKNSRIIGILEGIGVIPIVDTVGPYYPKLVKEFVCNMAEDIDDPTSPNFQSILNYQKEDILTTEDVEGPGLGFITISPKLIQVLVSSQVEDDSSASGGGNEERAKFLRDKICHLDGVIQTSLVRKSVLEARLKSLSGEANLDIGGSGAEAPQT
ncbi:hypothetical protein LIER_22399 [Lithospermum erythrorhizon]|uniref:Uncharacterized protein n=1 Tax=Lithospermum erythrorhizon TaxID=34254 RepID=A0AAV3QZH2_LITER